MKKYVAFAVVSLLVLACATNPLTGRKSLALVSNAELIPQALQQYNSVLSESKVLKNTSDANMIQKVGQKLQLAAEQFYRERGRIQELANYQWEFNLIESDQLNAWCMPGGKVAFYTGIMPVCKDETGVAVVMGHEIAHALAGHGSERMSQAMVAQGLGQAGGVALSQSQWSGLFQQIYPIGAQMTILKYGRNQELDADKAGLFLMAMAGYNPQEAPLFWNRMESATGSQSEIPEFMSTHPNPERRRSDLNVHMNEAMQYYNKTVGL